MAVAAIHPEESPATSKENNVTADLHKPTEAAFDEFDLDITIIESGPEADRLIRMTDDGCTSTCASACAGSC